MKTNSLHNELDFDSLTHTHYFFIRLWSDFTSESVDILLQVHNHFLNNGDIDSWSLKYDGFLETVLLSHLNLQNN